MNGKLIIVLVLVALASVDAATYRRRLYHQRARQQDLYFGQQLFQARPLVQDHYATKGGLQVSQLDSGIKGGVKGQQLTQVQPLEQYSAKGTQEQFAAKGSQHQYATKGVQQQFATKGVQEQFASKGAQEQFAAKGVKGDYQQATKSSGLHMYGQPMYSSKGQATLIESSKGYSGHLQQSVKGQQIESVKGQQVESVKGQQLETVKGQQLETVKGQQLETVKGQQIETVKGQQIETVKGPQLQQVDAVKSTQQVEVSKSVGQSTQLESGKGLQAQSSTQIESGKNVVAEAKRM